MRQSIDSLKTPVNKTGQAEDALIQPGHSEIRTGIQVYRVFVHLQLFLIRKKTAQTTL